MMSDLELRLAAGTVRGLRFAGPGERVLALHGWLDNAASFVPLASHLADIDLVAVDLLGHGRSDHRAPGAYYHFIDWVPDVVDMLDGLGWESCTLVGHSMGAGVVTLVAGALPSRVRSLVLLEGLGPLSSPAEEMPVRVAQAIVEFGAARQKSPRPHASVADAAARFAEAVAPIAPESARLLCERGTRPREGGVVSRADPRLRVASPMRLSEEQVLAFLRRIACPTLLVRARDGFPFDAAMMAARAAAVKNLRLVELDGGHHVHMDDAAAVASLIREHLAASKG